MADIKTPTLGESVTEASIARWTKKAGEPVKKDEVLVELETEKVSLEVASPADGVLSEILTPEGATVTPGMVLGRVAEGHHSVAYRLDPGHCRTTGLHLPLGLHRTVGGGPTVRIHLPPAASRANCRELW